jgi:murein DD-endopeptidase MepM/ murein hydrolase activator NlpD
MSKSVMFVVRIPGAMLGFVTHSSVVDAVIKPVDHSEVPIIDPESPDVLAAKEALYTAKPATPAAPVVDTKTVWPIHGQVTTEFGVPEWPYQAVHTGMDISDGSWRGTTPIVAFRQGKVIAVEHAGGLGNHVIVDHGSGVTSVYGHMTSTAVQVGQEVNTTTTLGYEGSTGVSTGPHVHFEIRVNGQATDPRKFINGQP